MSSTQKKAVVSENLLSIYGEPDYAIPSAKRTTFVLNLAKVGGCMGFISILFRKSVTFREVVSAQKKLMALQVAKGALLGGVTGGLYLGAVEQMSKYRGNEDGAINHFVAAYAGIAPYTILYRQNYRFFFIGGTIWGLFLMVVKSAGKTKIFDDMFAERKSLMYPTRYPEMYLFQRTRQDIEEGKFT